MVNDWIIDVLVDLKTFAIKNGLPTLAVHLENTALVATAEISSNEEAAHEMANWEVGSTRGIHRTAAAR